MKTKVTKKKHVPLTPNLSVTPPPPPPPQQQGLHSNYTTAEIRYNCPNKETHFMVNHLSPIECTAHLICQL